MAKSGDGPSVSARAQPSGSAGHADERVEGAVLPVVSARRAGDLRGALAAWLPALPLILLAVLFLVAPAILLIVQSFWGSTGPTLDDWATTLRSRVARKAMATTLSLSVLSATISTLVGTPVAWMISRMTRERRSIWLALLNVAGNFGGIGLGFSYLATLGTVGMVTLFLHGMGLRFRPPVPASFVGLALAYEYVNIPLFVLLTIPAMGALRNEWWEAAQTSSATRVQFWRYVGLPVLAPFVAGGWLLIFTWSIGIYAVAYALAGGGAGASIHLMTLEIGVGLEHYATFGIGGPAVLAVLLIAGATVTLLTYRALLRRALKWF